MNDFYIFLIYADFDEKVIKSGQIMSYLSKFIV